MREPPLKKVLYWCRACNVPLIGRSCACGAEGEAISLLKPYDLRPALQEDRELIQQQLSSRFGIKAVQQVVVLNKTGGLDRTEQVIMNGRRLGWITFDPFSRTYRMDLAFDALSFALDQITKGIVEIGNLGVHSRIGGKKLRVDTNLSDGPVVVRYGSLWGVGNLNQGYVRIKQVGKVTPETFSDPSWDEVVKQNRHHLRNLERHALRFIRQHKRADRRMNVSFSGGKDSTAVLELAKRAGVTEAYFVDTGLEFPETLEFIRQSGINIILQGGDFWKEVGQRGPPRKDDRWCCEVLKLAPVQTWLTQTGMCTTIQGTRWYESFTRSALSGSAVNPSTPSQQNIFPIRNWRALEVFLYLWWRGCDYNVLYEKGFERVGCWNCPAMLESEWDHTRSLHPDLHARWVKHLHAWAKHQGLPATYVQNGLWRWKDLPPKMREEGEKHGVCPRPLARKRS